MAEDRVAAVIRTVAGDIAAVRGRILAHEHLQIDLSAQKRPANRIGEAEEQAVVDDLRHAKEFGLAAIAYADGRYLCTSSQPFVDAARALVVQGYDPTRRLVMRRQGREQSDLAAPLGTAAGLTVESTRFGRPSLRPYMGFAGIELASPVRQNGRRVPRADSDNRTPAASRHGR
jgi:hypothetical protein